MDGTGEAGYEFLGYGVVCLQGGRERIVFV
jgi:hypothetical protein